MQLLAQNITYLRTGKQWSLRRTAEKTGISPSSLRSYEKGDTMPRITTLQKISKVFNRTLDELLFLNLEQADQTTPDHIKGDKIRILPIVVDEQSEKERVALVPVKAAAGYASGYADAEFIAELPRFSLPFPELSHHRTYRVFQIEGESMLPIPAGAYIICEYMQNWEMIDWGTPHIVITRDEGVVFKRLHQGGENILELHSDNPEFDPYNLPYRNIREVWKARGYVCFEFPSDPKKEA
ncbi:LexA family transcriptional regulator [Marinilabiliaceae bacterium JC017]|nr:LexA family transcriptional regulator [Marinilabiliaceae bacterium JC017]